MPAIRVKENEPFEVAMRRFKRAVEKTGLLTELRARRSLRKTDYRAQTQKSRSCKTPAKNACAANNCLLKCTNYRPAL